MYKPSIKTIGRSYRKRSTVLSTAISLALACSAGNVAFAQDDEELEEIVVTGSRIVQRDFESSSPIVTLGSETFEDRSNVGIEAALNQLPQFAPAGTQSQRSSAGSPFPASTAAPGAATINLRGLGENRNLVLIDGHRVQPVNGALVVDINTIPSAAIESVEIITGGAAAVYGADAISGVVNFKLKKNFEGAEFDAHYGITEEGDGEELSLSGLIGADFSDGRGNVMIGLNYTKREIILSKDRDWIVAGWDDPNTNLGGIGTTNLSSYVPGSNAPTIGFTPSSIYTIDPNGNIFDQTDPLNPDHPWTGPLGGDSGYRLNPDGSLGYQDRDISFLQLPLERYSMFASTTFELTDGIELFGDFRFTETQAQANGNIVQFNSIWSPTIPYDQAIDDPSSPTFGQGGQGVTRHPVPQALADLLNSRPDPTAPWTYEGTTDYLPYYQTDTTSNIFQLSGGLRGDFDYGNGFTDDWTWELYGSHGKTTVNAQQPEGFTHLPRSQQLFNADQYGKGWRTGEILAVTGNCESGLPIFNADGSVNDRPSVTQDCADYIVLRMNSITSLDQNIVEANMQGTLIEGWAGPIQFAAGATYREEDFRFEPDTGYNANQEFGNVVGNIALPVAVSGHTDVSEIYAEFAIPLLSDLPLIQSLSIDPGIRYSDYNASGEETTYKIMGDWVVNDSVRFRGGYQKANRAPNIAELFTPIGGSSIDFGAPDTCGSWSEGPKWGNVPENPNRFNLQVLCAELMTRDGAPDPFPIYIPGDTANDWKYNVFGAETYFPFDLAVEAGNPNLKSEQAETITAGVVITSPFESDLLANMQLSIDYYKIEILDAIDVPQHGTVYQQCMTAEFNSFIGDAPGSHTGAEMAANNPFCDLIQREYVGNGFQDYGADRRFNAAYINQGAIVTEGIDVQLDWAGDFDFGGLGVNMLVSFLDEYSVAPFPGAELIDYTGTMRNFSFDYQVLTTFSYSSGPFSANLRWQYLPGLDTAPGTAENIEGVGDYYQFDLSGRWAINDKYELRGGIDNLTNEEPRVNGASPTDANLGSSIGYHDTIGRRYYVAAKVRF